MSEERSWGDETVELNRAAEEPSRLVRPARRTRVPKTALRPAALVTVAVVGTAAALVGLRSLGPDAAQAPRIREVADPAVPMAVGRTKPQASQNPRNAERRIARGPRRDDRGQPGSATVMEPEQSEARPAEPVAEPTPEYVPAQEPVPATPRPPATPEAPTPAAVEFGL